MRNSDPETQRLMNTGVASFFSEPQLASDGVPPDFLQLLLAVCSAIPVEDIVKPGTFHAQLLDVLKDQL